MIYEIENFFADEYCDQIVGWFSTADKVEEGNAQEGFHGRTINYGNINNLEIKKLVNSFRFNSCSKVKELFGEEFLYPDYTDLVHWNVGSSMPLHADNCYLDGTPNYVSYRIYSGICYLNDNYMGGETFFKKGPSFIKPKKGKLVIWPSNLEYAHGVTAVIGGDRYTMPIWFTKDYTKSEI